MSTINTLKEQGVTSRPLLLADFLFPDGTTLYLSTHNGDSANGGASFNGHDYIGDLADENIDRLASLSEQGVDRIPSASVTISDAAGNYWTNYERGHGFRGATMTLTYVMYDVVTQTYSSDSFQPFAGICDQPKFDAEHLTVTATNKMNLTRFNLPTVPLSQRCPWVNPATAADRTTAGSAVKGDLFYPCGESRSLATAPPCSYTFATCTQPLRFGGVTWEPQKTGSGRDYLTGSKVEWINADTTQRYKKYVPLHLGGLLWLDAVPIAPFGDANYTRTEVIVGWGVINIRRVIVNGVELSGPTTRGDFRWHYINQGSRDGAPNTDVPYNGNGDPYGNMTAIQVLTPKSVFSPDSLPSVRVLCERGDLRVYRKIATAVGSGGHIVVTFDGPNEDCAGNPPFTVNIVGNSYSAANGAQTLTNWTFGPPGTITLTATGTGSGTGGYLWYELGATYGGAGGGAVPVWSLVEALSWTAIGYNDLAVSDFSDASKIARATITYTDNTGASATQSRFSMALALTQRRSAAEVVRAIRQSFGGILTPGADGKLHLRVEGPLAEQQPAAVDGSNYNTAISSTTRAGVSTNGYSAYDFNESNCWDLTRDGVQIASTPNKVSFPFQDPSIDYGQSTFNEFDSVDIGRVQQEIPGGLQVTPEGIASYNHASRIATLGLKKLLHGNPTGDTRGTDWYQWTTSFRGCKLQIGQIVRMSNTRLGLTSQQIRLTEIKPSRNFETVQLRGHHHEDAWYLDSAGNVDDPSYSNKAHDRLARPAYPWCPNSVTPITSDSVFDATDLTFSLQPVSTPDTAGNPIVSLRIGGEIPVNSPDTINAPVIGVVGTTATTGGTISGGITIYACVVAYASGVGTPSARSIATCRIDIAAGTNTNTATTPIQTWDPNTSTYELYAGTSPNLMTRQASGSGKPTSITITALNTRGRAVPDPEFNDLLVKVKKARHTGIVGTAVAAVSSTTITIGGTWTANALAGYDIALAGKADGSALPVANYRITANTTGGVLTVTPDPTGHVAVLDAVVIWSKPSVSGSVVTDALWVNPFGATGLASNAEAGKVLRVVVGTGRGLTYTIASNTSTALTLTSPPWMDSTSRYIIEEPGWFAEFPGTPQENTDPSKTTTIEVNVDNYQATTMLVAVFARDGGGKYFESLAPVRTIYVFGTTLGSRVITANSTQLPTDHTIYCDCTSNDVTYTLLPAAQWTGRRISIQHWRGGSFTTVIAAASGETIDDRAGGDVTSISLPAVGDVQDFVGGQ